MNAEYQLIAFGVFASLILMALILLAIVSALNKLGVAIRELRQSFDDFRTKVLADYVPRKEFRESIHELRNDMQNREWKNSQ